MTAEDPTPHAFFVPDGDAFVPTDRARGPWDPQSLHGRVISGLLAHEIEARHDADGFIVARLTVDMFRLAPHRPVTVETEVIREGNRIRVIDALMICDGRDAARATAVMLRTGEHPDTRPYPGLTNPLAPPGTAASREMFAPGERETSWDTRVLSGGFDRDGGQTAAWLRPLYPMVLGRESSPFVRLAAAADFAHPVANSGGGGLDFINADLTLYLHRAPAGEWFGFRSLGHHGEDGVAVGDTEVFDETGLLGKATVCAIANQRRP